MAVVGMTITQPANGAALLAGPAAARSPIGFRCALDADSAAGPQLQVRWWSSLPGDPGPVPSPGNPPDLGLVSLGSGLSIDRPLWIGTQAITVSAKDVIGDDRSSLETVGRAGTNGGAPPAPTPCVIHVLVALPIPPPPADPNAVQVVRRDAGVWAEAPATWNAADYAALDGLVYRWSFSPQGGPPVVVEPGRPGLAFLPRDTFAPRVGIPHIPASVPAGTYQLTLHVGFRADRLHDAFTLVAEATMKIQVQD